MERGILGCVGIGLALVGGLFFSLFLFMPVIDKDGNSDLAVRAGLVVFFGGMLAGGLLLAWRMLRQKPAAAAARGAGRPGVGVPTPPPPPQTDAERERRVLRFAEREHGRVTVPEVATNCDMSLAHSKQTLDRMVLAEVAQIHVTQSGVLVYVFAGFLSDEDKAKATDF